MQSTATQNKVQKSKGHAGRNAAAQRRTSHYSRVRAQLHVPTTPLFPKKTAMADTNMEGDDENAMMKTLEQRTLH